jgi:hypothetical protein
MVRPWTGSTPPGSLPRYPQYVAPPGGALERGAAIHLTIIDIPVQLGHQAINCTNGTINWKQIYGEDSFKLKTPIYPSEYDAIAKAKQVDVEKLKKLAQEWKNVNFAAHISMRAYILDCLLSVNAAAPCRQCNLHGH